MASTEQPTAAPAAEMAAAASGPAEATAPATSAGVGAPRPLYKEYAEEFVKKLSTVQDGTGYISGIGDIGLEVAIWTTDASPVKLRLDSSGASGPLIFHMGWPGVPPAWQAAIKLMTWREIARFQAEAGDLRGPRGGKFESFVDGLPDDDNESVQFEVELRFRSELVNVTQVDASTLPKDRQEEDVSDDENEQKEQKEDEAKAPEASLQDDHPLARFWVRLVAGSGAGRPLDFTNVTVHLRIQAVSNATFECIDSVGTEAEHVLLNTKAICVQDGKAIAEPARFTLEGGASCPVLERVIRAMRMGDHARLLLSAGVLDMPGALGVAAPFVLMRLATRWDGPLEIEISDLVFEDIELHDESGLLAYAGKIRTQGNELVKDKEFSRAIGWYRRALKTLKKERAHQPIIQEGTDIGDQARAAKVAILSNAALCCLSVDDALQALDFCKEALELAPDNPKVLFRKGKALVALGEHGQAVTEFTTAAKLEPKDAAIRGELEKARKNAAEFKEKEQQRFGGMFNELQGFAAESRPAAATKEPGLGLAFEGDDNYGYKLICKLEENPYISSTRPNEDAEQLQAEGRLEEAVWAWEAAISNTAAVGNWSMCYSCWLELACLYLDLRADAIAVLCLERFLSPKDLPTAPLSLLRHAHLLCAICMLTQAPDNAKLAVEASLSAWLDVARADKLLETGQIQASFHVELAIEADKESTALAMDACIGVSIIGLTVNNPDAATRLAQAIAKPEVQGSFFGDARRRAMRWNLLGAVLARAGRLEAATNAYAKALADRPHYPRALANMAQTLASSGRRKQAAAAYAQAAQIMPKDLAAGVWKSLGSEVARFEQEDVFDLVRAVGKRDTKEFLKLLGTNVELPRLPDNPHEALREICGHQ